MKKEFPWDFSQEEIEIIQSVKDYTMTCPEMLYSLIHAVKYVVQNNIRGDIVECGVWKGGSIMAAAKTLMLLKALNRKLYLFDTFDGYPKPENIDMCASGIKAVEEFNKRKNIKGGSDWCHATLDEVKNNVYSTGYNKKSICFIEGKVEDTIPDKAPETISILRLETDWYESTRHELMHLFPRLSRCGVIIIDDYCYWEGVKKATDEYIAQNKISIFLSRIDQHGRLGIKT